MKQAARSIGSVRTDTSKHVRAWCPKCRRYLVVELAEGEQVVKREYPQCNKRGLVGLGVE